MKVNNFRCDWTFMIDALHENWLCHGSSCKILWSHVLYQLKSSYLKKCVHCILFNNSGDLLMASYQRQCYHKNLNALNNGSYRNTYMYIVQLYIYLIAIMKQGVCPTKKLGLFCNFLNRLSDLLYYSTFEFLLEYVKC